MANQGNKPVFVLRTGTFLSALLAMLLAALFAFSACVVTHAASKPAAGSSADAVTETLMVDQSVAGKKDPQTVTGTYGLLPGTSLDPLPVSAESGEVNRFTLNGNADTSATFTFTEPGTYNYTLGKLADPSKKDFTEDDFEEGTEAEPLTHRFGFKVNRDETGKLVVTPFTCNDPTIEPTDNGLIVHNKLSFEEPAPSKTRETPSRKTPSRVTRQPTKKGGKVNTGDESHLVLWIVLLVVAAIAVVLLFLARRKKEDNPNDDGNGPKNAPSNSEEENELKNAPSNPEDGDQSNQ